jgi:hypothetical protein
LLPHLTETATAVRLTVSVGKLSRFLDQVGVALARENTAKGEAIPRPINRGFGSQLRRALARDTPAHSDDR